jgi:ParB family chromosome partitioning protein
MRRKGLGRGLSDLLSGDTLAQSRAVIEVPLDDIEPNPMQPRQAMDDASLEELTLSIETHGVLQPILVRQVDTGYQLVAGERRWRAARRAGLHTVPCLVQTVDDIQSLELAMIENLQRDDLNAIDAARGYRMLVTEFGLTQEDVARKIGKSRSAIANTLRILDLPTEVQEDIRSSALTEGHGRALLPLLGHEDFPQVLESVRELGLSVRETERLVREKLSPAEAEEAKSPAIPAVPRATARDRGDSARDPHVAAAEQRLQTALAAKVVIRPGAKRGGVIHIRYYDQNDLERLMAVLSVPEDES